MLCKSDKLAYDMTQTNVLGHPGRTLEEIAARFHESVGQISLRISNAKRQAKRLGVIKCWKHGELTEPCVTCDCNANVSRARCEERADG